MVDLEQRFSMGVVTRLTGLTADTIRKWEERHQAVRPRRTAGNTRKYSADDVRRLTLLRELVAQGHRIADVAALSTAQLEDVLRPPAGDDAVATAGDGPRTRSGGRLSASPGSRAHTGSGRAAGDGALRSGVGQTGPAVVVADYLTAIGRFDARRGSEILTGAATIMRSGDFATRIVLPVLQETGRRWEAGDFGPAHEHLVSAQLRGLLTTMLHWGMPLPGADRVVITTPESHWHEFGVLVGALLAAGRGLEPVYLGPNLPADEILRAVAGCRARLVILSVVRDLTREERRRLGRDLARIARRVTTWVGLPPGHELRRANVGARYFDDFGELEMALTQLAGRQQ